jgi:hypothetical protein
MLDNNPIDSRTAEAKDTIRLQFPQLVFLNLQKLNVFNAKKGDAEPATPDATEIILNDGPVEIHLPIFRPKN